MHINREIEKTNKRRFEKPKPIKNNKAIPLFLYPVEAVIYQKSDTVNLKKNILAGAPERAKFEMEVLLRNNNVKDFEISVSMPQGHTVNIIAEDAGRSIHGSFEPFIKAERERADRQKKLDLLSASRSAKIEKSRDGAENADIAAKLQQAHNKGKYI